MAALDAVEGAMVVAEVIVSGWLLSVVSVIILELLTHEMSFFFVVIIATLLATLQQCEAATVDINHNQLCHGKVDICWSIMATNL